VALTEERLAEIEARCAAATAGPWWCNTDGPWDAIVAEGSNGNADTDDYYGGRLVAESAASVDVEFIANARTDVPELLEDVSTTRAMLADALAEATRAREETARLAAMNADALEETRAAWTAYGHLRVMLSEARGAVALHRARLNPSGFAGRAMAAEDLLRRIDAALAPQAVRR
jgi:hypothetical protein